MPPELLEIVASLLCEGGQPVRLLTLRTLSALFANALQPQRWGLLHIRTVRLIINRATWDGDLATLKWLFSSFQISVAPNSFFGEFPTAVALERGHWQLLDFFFNSCHFPPKWLARMNKSLPVAVRLQHWDTVQWVVDFLESCYQHIIQYCDLETVKQCLVQKNAGIYKSTNAAFPMERALKEPTELCIGKGPLQGQKI